MGLRVLQMTLSFSRGGRREAILRLAAGLRPLGVECDLCSLTELDADSRSAAGGFGRVETVSSGGLWDRVALDRLRRFTLERGHAIVHVHDAPSHFLAFRLRAFTRGAPRVVMTFHRSLGIDSERLRDRLRNALALRAVSAVVTGSSERQAYFRRSNWIRPSKVIRIPFGVDTSRFRPDPGCRVARRRELGLSEGALLVGSVGHFGAEKGLDVAIRGFVEWVGRSPGREACLVVLGDGSAEARAGLEVLAGELMGGRVRFLGFQREVETWLPAFDLLLHTPRQEAFGLAIVEAMSCGVPVIGSSVGGVPELVWPGHTGLLVASEDPAAVAEALARLADDPGLRAALGAGARELAEREFDTAGFARRHLDLYNRVLEPDKPPASFA